jgi:tetratricopeptide (TPR) repeat protein
MRGLLLCFFVLMPFFLLADPQTNDSFEELKVEFGRKGIYDGQKEAHIRVLKNALNQVSADDLKGQFEACSKLYEEYKSYQYDSAYVYANRLLYISSTLHDKPKEDFSKIKVGFILLSSGMFKETFDSMKGIDVRDLDNGAKVEYYSIIMRAYYDLANYNSDRHYSPAYTATANKYIDSAIALSKPGSYDNIYLTGYKKSKNGFNDEAAVIFYRLLNSNTLTEHQKAIVASTLSNVYLNTPQQEKSIRLLIQATISDIRSSTKETIALFWLAEILYKKGDIKNAYVALEHALADAEFYGARQRKVQIGTLLPIVASEKLLFIDREEKLYIRSLSMITVLAASIIVVSILLYKRNKKLKVKEKIIEKVNEKLMEGTKIKEDYIGYFFNVISGYILQLERIKRSVDTKLPAKKYDDLQLMANNINIKKERETLFNTFDQVFIKIFPNFVEEFNTLFTKENQIWPKENEVLTTDLRIFALMRMGITDTETIAKILEYSEKTIYVYKMRIKAKAIIHGDEFDHRIMAIKAVDINSKS